MSLLRLTPFAPPALLFCSLFTAESKTSGTGTRGHVGRSLNSERYLHTPNLGTYLTVIGVRERSRTVKLFSDQSATTFTTINASMLASSRALRDFGRSYGSHRLIVFIHMPHRQCTISSSSDRFPQQHTCSGHPRHLIYPTGGRARGLPRVFLDTLHT